MTLWILWQKQDLNITTETNEYEYIIYNKEIRIQHSQYHIGRFIIYIPFSTYLKSTHLRWNIIPNQWIQLVWDGISETQEFPSYKQFLVQEFLYQTFLSHIKYIWERLTPETLQTYQKNPEVKQIQYNSLQNLPNSIIHEWKQIINIPSITNQSQWFSVDRGQIQTSPVFLSTIQLDQLPIFHICFTTELPLQFILSSISIVPNSKHLIIASDDIFTNEIRKHINQEITIFTETEWKQKWIHHQKKHHYTFSWNDWRRSGIEDPFYSVQWDSVHWISIQSIHLAGFGVHIPIPYAKPNETHLWCPSLAIWSHWFHQLRYKWYSERFCSFIHPSFFDFYPDILHSFANRTFFLDIQPNIPFTTELKTIETVIPNDPWSQTMSQLLLERGDLYEQKRVLWGVSQYNYPNCAIQILESETKPTQNLEQTCAVSYETNATKTMIEWPCHHVLEETTHWKWLAVSWMSHRFLSCPTCRFRIDSRSKWKRHLAPEQIFNTIIKPFGPNVDFLCSYIYEFQKQNQEFGIILPEEPIGTQVWAQLSKWSKLWSPNGKKRIYTRNGFYPNHVNIPNQIPPHYQILWDKIQIMKHILFFPTQSQWIWITRSGRGNTLPLEEMKQWVLAKPNRTLIYTQNDSFVFYTT